MWVYAKIFLSNFNPTPSQADCGSDAEPYSWPKKITQQGDNMEEKKLYHFGAWSAFAMALMLIVNGVTTFVPPY